VRIGEVVLATGDALRDLWARPESKHGVGLPY
jgi:hypothetical protein